VIALERERKMVTNNEIKQGYVLRLRANDRDLPRQTRRVTNIFSQHNGQTSSGERGGGHVKPRPSEFTLRAWWTKTQKETRVHFVHKLQCAVVAKITRLLYPAITTSTPFWTL
jgi:hypothetical protein